MTRRDLLNVKRDLLFIATIENENLRRIALAQWWDAHIVELEQSASISREELLSTEDLEGYLRHQRLKVCYQIGASLFNNGFISEEQRPMSTMPDYSVKTSEFMVQVLR